MAKWIIIGLLAVVVLIALLRRGPDAKLTKAVEAWQKADIARRKRAIAKLQDKTVDTLAKTAQLRQQLEAKKEELNVSFASKGLSAEEIAERFRRLNLD